MSATQTATQTTTRTAAEIAAETTQELPPIHAVRPNTPGLPSYEESAEMPSGSYFLAMALVGFTWIVACVALFGLAMISITG